MNKNESQNIVGAKPFDQFDISPAKGILSEEEKSV
jgi:hypothetical protein